ncbi:MAG: c-type cytochrome [Methylocella sp.]
MRLLQLVITAAVAAATLAPAAGFAQVVEGRRAWLKFNCYGCHGNNGAGGMGPNIQHAESGDVSQAMTGDATEGGMRSFSGIATAQDATNIAAYLATIGAASEPKWLDWWNPIP